MTDIRGKSLDEVVAILRCAAEQRAADAEEAFLISMRDNGYAEEEAQAVWDAELPRMNAGLDAEMAALRAWLRSARGGEACGREVLQ